MQGACPNKSAATHWLALGVLLIFAGGCRWYRIDHWSLFADEVWSAMASRDGSWSAMFRYIIAAESHPPGYHVVLRITQMLAGMSDVALRFPSWLAGTALVYAVYAYGRQYLGRITGLLAAVIVCNHYYAIYYSQEARAYALLMLAILLHVHALTGWLLSRYASRRGSMLLMIGSGVMAAYLHYAGVVYVAVGGVMVLLHWLRHRDRTLLINALVGYGCISVLYVPWLPGLFHQLINGPVEAWQRPPTAESLWQTWRLIAGENPARAVWWAVLAVGGMVALWRQRTPSARAVLLLLPALVALPMAVFFIKSQFSMPVYNARSFTPAISLVALLAAYPMALGITAIPSVRGRVFALVAVLLMISAVQWSANFQHQLYTGHRFKQEYRQAVELALQRQAMQGGELIIGNVFFNHYVEQHAPFKRTHRVFSAPDQLDGLVAQLHAQGIERFYFLDMYSGGARSSPLMDALAARYRRVCQTDLVLVRVVGYVASDPVSMDAVPEC